MHDAALQPLDFLPEAILYDRMKASPDRYGRARQDLLESPLRAMPPTRPRLCPAYLA
jgi:hypothetical protein